jgi:energy-coupling factor transporter transmembrane protein EcfT
VSSNLVLADWLVQSVPRSPWSLSLVVRLLVVAFFTVVIFCMVLYGMWMAPMGGHVVVVHFFNSHRVFWHRGDFVSLCVAWG